MYLLTNAQCLLLAKYLGNLYPHGGFQMFLIKLYITLSVIDLTFCIWSPISNGLQASLATTGCPRTLGLVQHGSLQEVSLTEIQGVEGIFLGSVFTFPK